MALRAETRGQMDAAQAASLRRASFAMGVLLLAQYALGIGVNLFVTLPPGDAGGNIGSGFGHAVSNGPVVLAVHAVLGVLLVVNALVIMVRALRAGTPLVTALAVIGAVSLVGAAVTGSQFVTNGRNGASMGMAMAWGVGLLCYLVMLFVLADRSPAA